MKRQRVIICGSTGSIGTQTLDILRQFPDRFDIVALSVGSNISLLIEQIHEFKPEAVSIQNKTEILGLQNKFPSLKVFHAADQEQMIKEIDADLLLLAVCGEYGIPLARAALASEKHLLIATKEVIVAAGEEIVMLAEKYQRDIRPIDSEHSAIWQCLRTGKQSEVRKIWLTCSGGPFLDPQKWTTERLKSVTPAEAVAHPNWSMGKKISVDSATLMNKALEVIEAIHLFQLSPDKVEVVIHPQSALHSAVEFNDGSVIGQIGTADMRTAIAYALFYPERPVLPYPKFSFFGKHWDFAEVDTSRFPSIEFAKQAYHQGRCAEFNRANEKAVADFLSGSIGFLEIFERVEAALS